MIRKFVSIRLRLMMRVGCKRMMLSCKKSTPRSGWAASSKGRGRSAASGSPSRTSATDWAERRALDPVSNKEI